jgi:Rrf2 family transcriptional regulator, iron-sulfur cluster assembly transcription factor
MIRYGKSSQNAIAAMSRLAEVYKEGRRLTSQDISEDRHLTQTITAKLLTQLSQSGLVSGAPGPGGGYALARPPAEISLYDITLIFERGDDSVTCPFGPEHCGVGRPCPLHDKLVELRSEFEGFMKSTTIEIFVCMKRPRES